MPHAVFRPRTRLPLTWYSLSLPTTAKGMTSCKTEREGDEKETEMGRESDKRKRDKGREKRNR